MTGLKIGDKLNVKFMGCNSVGRLVFSRRALLSPPSKATHPSQRSQQKQQPEQSETDSKENTAVSNGNPDSVDRTVIS